MTVASITETTPEGEQTVVPGVTPITAADRLALRAAAPMEPSRVQKPCDHGLFDVEGRKQIDWIDEAHKEDRR
ncbi:MAG: hypothetical protein RIE24_08000 [Silicimonas sp.]|uniref:hypothetical protein n=1 Tax=Roseitalea porphyridii TaxID=1852022 RepID=UPI0032EAE3B8